MNELKAIFIDTISIQNYIFSSNRLKHNVGASYIVSKVYDFELKEALNKTFGVQVDVSSWQENPSKILIEGDSIPCEIGYIGGGNALILIKDEVKVKECIKRFTSLVLERYPGLRTAFSVSYNFDLSNFKDSMKVLHSNLKENKNKYFSQVVLPKYGFTAECLESGESAELFKSEDANFISGVVRAKILAESTSLKAVNERFKSVLDDKYGFTNNLDILGQVKEKDNFVAVIHIDGNKIGDRFEACETLEDYRRLSRSMKEATINAFKEMIISCIKNIENDNISEEEGFNLDMKNGKTILPFRPIIISGDDITFVSNGRLALFLTEIFIKNFIKQPVSDDQHHLSACAGICIVKTKYPFYRSYHLAENLLKHAKQASRDEDNSSFIDFFISSGGFSGDFDDILESYFRALEGVAHFGPYRIDRDDKLNSFNELKRTVIEFHKWPKNKVMELRELLYGSRDDAKRFVDEINAKVKEIKLYELRGMNFHTEVWEHKKTPYFDAIELLDFYPSTLMRGA